MSQAAPASALTVHGGRIDLAWQRFPDAAQPWIDLSTGINPRAYPVATKVDPSALPSPAALASLEAAAGAAFGLRTGSIAALPGSEIGLRLLATLGLPGPACRVVPAYGTHAHALPSALPVAFADLADAASTTLLLANPNNPDGRVTPARDLLALAPRDGWLVVDEAFADAVPDASVLPHVTASDRVIVFRSFGKFYGLAGLRLGFVCGPAEIVARFRDLLGDWPVSAAALATGIAAYRDTAWQAATRTALGTAADALDAVLRRHHLEPRGGCSLFRLVERDDAAALFERLGRAGILTRPFADAPHWLRIGVPRDAVALARLDAALGHG